MARYTEVLQSDELTKLDLTILGSRGAVAAPRSRRHRCLPLPRRMAAFQIDSRVELTPWAHSMLPTPPSSRCMAPIGAASLPQFERRFEARMRRDERAAGPPSCY